MNLSSGYPLWLIRNGLPFDYPKLRADKHADTVVIGGGISGALTAYQLQRAGIEVCVVDGRTIGLGSTCASTSLLQYELDKPLCRLRDQIGTEKADRAYRICVDAVGELQALSNEIGFTGVEGTSSVYFAAKEKHIPLLLAEMDARTEIGIEVEWLDRVRLQQHYGIDAPAAIITRPAAKMDAYSFTHALHQQSIACGANVYDRTHIKHITRRGKGFRLFTEEDVRLDCRRIVFANGYEVAEHIDKPIVKLASTYAIASEQLLPEHPLLQQHVLLWSTADPYLYLRTTKDNRMIIGGRDEDFASPERRDKLIQRKSRLLEKDLEKLAPGLRIRHEFAWAGTFGSTGDSLPYIGQYPGKPGMYFALGFGGNGILFSHIAAKIVTDMLLGKQVKDEMLFSFER